MNGYGLKVIFVCLYVCENTVTVFRTFTIALNILIAIHRLVYLL